MLKKNELIRIVFYNGWYHELESMIMFLLVSIHDLVNFKYSLRIQAVYGLRYFDGSIITGPVRISKSIYSLNSRAISTIVREWFTNCHFKIVLLTVRRTYSLEGGMHILKNIRDNGICHSVYEKHLFWFCLRF